MMYCQLIELPLLDSSRLRAARMAPIAGHRFPDSFCTARRYDFAASRSETIFQIQYLHPSSSSVNVYLSLPLSLIMSVIVCTVAWILTGIDRILIALLVVTQSFEEISILLLSPSEPYPGII